MYTKNFKYIQWSYVKKDPNNVVSSSSRLGPQKQNLLSIEKKSVKGNITQYQRLDEGYIESSRIPLEEQKYSQGKNTKSKNSIAKLDWMLVKEK